MAKQDYSRLLDDEFLNAGGRVRVRVVTRRAAEILGAAPSYTPSYTTVLACGLAAAMLGAMLTLLVCLGTPAAIIAHPHHAAHPRQPAALVGSSVGSSNNKTGQSMDEAAVVSSRPRPASSPLLDRMKKLNEHGHASDESGSDEDYGHSSHEGDASALWAGFFDPGDSHEDGHPHGLHEHVHAGDVVLGDHHILAAGNSTL